MARVLAAHQPNFLPWLGYLAKAARADVFVLADDVQYTKHGYINRNRVRTAEGWQWLTVPVRTRGRSGQAIAEVEIESEQPWGRKHLQTLDWNCRNAPFYEAHMADLRPLFEAPPARLVELNRRLLEHLFRELEIDAEVHLTSELDLRDERSERIADMAVACGCDVYLAGDGGSTEYLDEAVLQQAGVAVAFAGFTHPTYPQCFPGFEPGMNALDLLFNCGPRSAAILRS